MRLCLCTMIRINTFLYVFMLYIIHCFFLSPSRDKGAIIGHALQCNIILLFIIYYYMTLLQYNI